MINYFVKKMKHYKNIPIFIKFKKDKDFEYRLNFMIFLSKFFNYKRTNHGDKIEELIPSYLDNIIYYSDIGDIENTFCSNFNLDKIYKSYQIFSDEYSKDLYLSQLINYSFVGENSKGTLFLLYYSHIWNQYKKVENSIKDKLDNLFLFDLSNINIPIKLYYPYPYGLFSDFILEQYKYKNKVYVSEGDIVIDGGGYMGDTALYFANLVGKTGKVYSFECVDSNLNIFYKNLDLNPNLKDIISIQKYPLYDKSNQQLNFADGADASRIMDNGNLKVISISIDDFVENNKLQKVNFIKMDIEGAELKALKGAKNTLSRFRPNLAISLYHSFSDYYEIPLLLSEILYEYEFYFDHFKLGRGESILFCKAK
ncbi:FkbM family methyltransferase [uncultured Brachyspira sp.]|uniref:FkbM family methyltransferase n=1 Tax=uncultured Brachyspira sp. TaxID=221953 RepID=UPI0025908194|nr:FkbM family methyltransferase [uncultured Brachyspira sp.]